MDAEWITTSWGAVLGVIVTSVGVYLAVLVFTRVFGLRSFSKLSSFDFAITVAIGSVVASTVLAKDPPLLQAAVALGTLYALKVGLSVLRHRLGFVESLVDNSPILLMVGDRILEENLRAAKMTHSDLRAKLREANVLHWGQIRAVVMETTGDVSVLHGDADGPPLDRTLLEGVRGCEALDRPDVTSVTRAA